MTDSLKRQSYNLVKKQYYTIEEVSDILTGYGLHYYDKFMKSTIRIEHSIVNVHNINYNALREYFIVNQTAIRYWEKHFNIKIKRSNKNYRKYSNDNVKFLMRLFYYLKIQGMDINILKMKVIMNEVELKET